MERYREIIPNYKNFKKVLNIAQPIEIRVNTIKSSIKEVMELLNREQINFEQRKWNENFFKLKQNPSKTLGHWLGKYYIQETVSGIPPVVLKPKPEEKVLDMCAAPGSKTTQISAMMENKGHILANDVRAGKTRSLLSNLYRMGCVNVKVTERDARNLPESKKFDKILVDVPCSAEGNLRGKKFTEEGADLEQIKELSNLQTKLLEKAFKLCKERGEIVYSTCTFAPEENELVVSKFLDKGDLIDPKLELFHSKGITKWSGTQMDNKLKKCIRVYPHQLNSGGIFIAKFEKKA